MARDWEGTVSGPFVPVLAQPDCGRAEPSSARDGRSSGGGVRPGAPGTPALARPIAAAPAPGLTVWSGAFGPSAPASGATPAPGAAAEAAPARAPAVPAAPAVATCAATPAAWAGLRRAQRAAR